MKKHIVLRLDPWSQLAIWLIVLLLAAERIKPALFFSTAQAQESNALKVVDVNVAQIGGAKINQENGIPVRQVGPPPTSRVGPGNFPFQKVEQ